MPSGPGILSDSGQRFHLGQSDDEQILSLPPTPYARSEVRNRSGCLTTKTTAVVHPMPPPARRHRHLPQLDIHSNSLLSSTNLKWQ